MSDERPAGDAGVPGMPPGPDLPIEVHRLLLQHASAKSLPAHDSLFLRGSAPNQLFGVVSGRVRVASTSPAGREALIAILEPGRWCGEVSLLVGEERVYDATAMVPSQLAIVDAAVFHRLVKEHADVHMAFTRLVCRRLREALDWVDRLMLDPLPSRMAYRLLDLHDSRGHGGPLELSQEDLAAMLGVSRQSVNRELKLWAAEGLVEARYGRIRLVDRARLVALLQAPMSDASDSLST
jgi:CRP-like cAMP-binding protein